CRQQQLASLEGCEAASTLGKRSLREGDSVKDEERSRALENTRACEDQHVAIRQQACRGVGHIVSAREVSRCGPCASRWVINRIVNRSSKRNNSAVGALHLGSDLEAGGIRQLHDCAPGTCPLTSRRIK